MDTSLTNLGLIQHYSLNQIITHLALAVVLGLAISWLYKHTHRGVSYSHSFVVALVLIVIVTATAIMVIGNNLTRAFGLIGAFSVVRFRAAIKDARDIAFVFFALVEGLASGVGAFELAVIAFVTFAIITVFLVSTHFTRASDYEYLLTFHTPAKDKVEASYLNMFNQKLAEYLLISFRSTSTEKVAIATYNIRLKASTTAKDFMNNLKKTGATNIELISSQSDVDY